MLRSSHSQLAIVLFYLLLVLLFGGCAPVQPSGGAQQPPQMNSTEFWFSTIWFLLVGLSVYYLVVIRPQVSHDDARQKFIKELKKGDEVMTSGGIIGKVVAVNDDHVAVEIATNVKVRVALQHVVAMPAKSAPDTAGKS